MTLALVMIGFTSAFAQVETDCDDEFPQSTAFKYSVATNSFWANWFLQVGFDAEVIRPYRIPVKYAFQEGWECGLNLAVGKWFTPGIGMRLKVKWGNGMFSTGAYKYGMYYDGKYQYELGWWAPWGPEPEHHGYLGFFLDPMFNMSNLFFGYNKDRVWNLILFPRAGLAYNGTNDHIAPFLGVGIESSWRLNDHWRIYVDGALEATSNHFLSYPNGIWGHDKGWANFLGSVELGIQYNLGKTDWSKAVKQEDWDRLREYACNEITSLRSQLAQARDSIAMLQDLLDKERRNIKSQNVIAGVTSVFFDLNSSVIKSHKDMINLESLAAVAKETGAILHVRASADSRTGSSSINQKLSESRAKAVAEALIKLGVSPEKIETVAVGGVMEVDPHPFELNRRAIVEIKGFSLPVSE